MVLFSTLPTNLGNRSSRFPHSHRYDYDGIIPKTSRLRDTHSEGKVSLRSCQEAVCRLGTVLSWLSLATIRLSRLSVGEPSVAGDRDRGQEPQLANAANRSVGVTERTHSFARP